jgi:hypothetical protein
MLRRYFENGMRPRYQCREASVGRAETVRSFT